MNDIQLQETLKNAVKPRFRGRKQITCKAVLRYPESAEREFRRIGHDYVRILNEELKKYLPKLLAAYKKEHYDSARFDDMQDLELAVKEAFEKIAEAVERKIAKFKLEDRIAAVAEMTKNMSYREWKRAVKDTLGIDLMKDYYNGDFYAEYLQKWISDNVLKIKSIPYDTLVNMKTTIQQGFMRGVTITDLKREIQHEYHLSKSAAALIARDQISTLNSQITQAQQRDAGVEKYKWKTSHDSRVRDCHATFDGKIFRWDDPPEIWYKTKSRGIIYTGRRCHPGEDYACRCVAIPVFEIDKIELPMAGDK